MFRNSLRAFESVRLSMLLGPDSKTEGQLSKIPPQQHQLRADIDRQLTKPASRHGRTVNNDL